MSATPESTAPDAIGVAPRKTPAGQGRGRASKSRLPSRSEQAQAFAPIAIDFDADIVKANAIINARYFLPLNAHRLLSLYLSLLSRNDEPFPLMKISMTHVAESFPGLSSSKSVYADVSKALEQLFSAEIHVKQGEDWLRFRWAPTCGRQGGYIFLRMNEDLRPYLSGLVRQFTHYRLRFVLELRSPYHFRFYELFKSYQYLGSCKVYFESSKEWLEIPADQYTNSGHFKDKILDPSIKAINDVTDVLVSIATPIKDGRKIVGWVLNVRSKPQEELPLPPTVAPIVERLVADGFSPEEAKSFARDYDDAYLMEKIEFAENQFEQGIARTLTGFLRDAIHKDYRVPRPKTELQAEKAEVRVSEERERAAREEYEQRVRKARDAAPYDIRLRKAQELHQKCDDASRENLERAFADHVMKLGGRVVREYSEKGRDSQFVAPLFRTFICDYFAVPETTLEEVQDHLAMLIPAGNSESQ